MRKYVIAGILTVALAAPALAANSFFVVVDTVKNCSVIEGNPSAGLTPIVKKDGFESKAAAQEALKGVRDDAAQCAGVVE